MHGNMAENSCDGIIGKDVPQSHRPVADDQPKQPRSELFRVAQVIGARDQQTGDNCQRACLQFPGQCDR